MEVNVLFSICEVILEQLQGNTFYAVVFYLKKKIGWHGLLCQRLLKDRGKYRWVRHYYPLQMIFYLSIQEWHALWNGWVENHIDYQKNVYYSQNIMTVGYI